MEPLETTENYLEAILMIKQKQGYVRSVDIAEQLKVSKPSVRYATKKLYDLKYINFDEHGMILFTKSGQKIAEDVYLKHTTLTKIFVYLGVSEKQARIDACKVEHDLSEETFNAIKKWSKKI